MILLLSLELVDFSPINKVSIDNKWIRFIRIRSYAIKKQIFMLYTIVLEINSHKNDPNTNFRIGWFFISLISFL